MIVESGYFIDIRHQIRIDALAGQTLEEIAERIVSHATPLSMEPNKADTEWVLKGLCQLYDAAFNSGLASRE